MPIQAVNALMAALIFRDPMTAEHSRRVADFCVLVARGQMSEEQCYILEVSALLHDMGKLGVPDSILLKPGPLTEEERKIMSTHDRIGVEILRDAFSSKDLSDIRRHLSCLVQRQSPRAASSDGREHSGRCPNPDDRRRLRRHDLGSRLSQSPSLRRKPSNELRRCAGDQFDPTLVERFIDVVSKDPLHNSHREISRQMALAMGIQAERIAVALECRDFDSLARWRDNSSLRRGSSVGSRSRVSP